MFVVLPVIPFPAIDPVLISVGPFAVRWYALAYIVGIIAGWFCARGIISSPRLWGGAAPLSMTDFDDFVIWITLGIILGGRIGYVLFYNFAHFAANPIEIVQLWNGGMSFHGGVIGCVLAVVLFALRRHLPVLSLADVTAAVAPIGLFLVRIANFINGELWGRPTDIPWAMVFPHGGPIPRHPSQLYEAALEGVILLIVVALLVRFGALKRPGVITGVFALGYGAARIACEFFREPDAQLGFLWGGLTMGMLLCVPLIIGGIAVLIVAFQRMPKPKND
jgi:phosphatidylglycerol---prolipoprotein diacylglyceryl transferase